MTLKSKSIVIIPEQNLTDIKMFLVDFKIESLAIDTPYLNVDLGAMLFGPRVSRHPQIHTVVVIAVK